MSEREDCDRDDAVKATIGRYYQGCNTGDVELMVSTMTSDVVHYFLEPGTEAVAGAEHLARYWRKVRRMFDGRWAIDYIFAKGTDAVIEWTLSWTNPETGARLATRGAEFYVMRDGLIAEIRAYYNQLRDADSGLVGFDYVTRGYSPKQMAGAGDGRDSVRGA
jgi:ketosteroid isomerase-like protein